MSSLNPPADLILYNARVLTMDFGRPTVQMVAVKGDRILWVGRDGDIENLRGPYTRLIDCQGLTLIPGFIDAHCHLLAYAASLLYMDCSPAKVSSIQDIKVALKSFAEHVKEGQWIRATGYNEFYLKEKRHPNRWDLDQALPNRPVRLNHYSGHACVLNSMALAQVGISSQTPDPTDGVIERDWATGEPTGLLLEMDSYLDRAISPMSKAEFSRGVGLANHRLVSAGITSIQDATHTNSLRQWQTVKGLKQQGLLAPRVTVMPGIRHLEDFLQAGLSPSSGDADLNLGPVKIMLTATTGSLQPYEEELRGLVLAAHKSGFQVAIHAVEAQAVEAAVQAIGYAAAMHPRPDARHRIEHCSECPPRTLEKLRSAGIVIVTQPAFLYHNGQKYMSEVAPEMQPWLYSIGSLARAGVRVAFSSDAPVVPPNPVIGIYAAVTRRTSEGQALSTKERISALQALEMYTRGGAYAALQERDRGSIEAGKLADLVLLDGDPTPVLSSDPRSRVSTKSDLGEVACDPEALKDIRAILTVIGGKVVWER